MVSYGVVGVVPETRFAHVGEDQVAYQVLGEGPTDLLYMSGIGDCIDARWEYRPFASFLERLASFCRLIMFDRRGTGASDPVPLDALPPWEEWAQDALAVLDAVESERASVLGINDAGAPAILLAATQPERTRSLILANATAGQRFGDGSSSGPDLAATEIASLMRELWGSEEAARLAVPDHAEDMEFVRWNAKNMRMSCSRREAAAYLQWATWADVRHVLPSIRVPTLVVHRWDARHTPVEHARYLVEHIEGARFAPVQGSDITIYTKPNAQTVTRIEEFLTDATPAIDAARALAAVLFTDIVGSTSQAAAMGDRRWRGVLERHDEVARMVVDEHRGRLVKFTGDGVLAAFDGPGRAIRCARALQDALSTLDIRLRAGLHTGEVEMRGDDIGGIGVHVAARILDHAGPGEILCSAVVPMLVAGSGIEFEDRGEQPLRGIPEPWRLFAVEG